MTPPDPQQVAEIAGRLSDPHRYSVLAASPAGFGAWRLRTGTGRGMTALGLATRSIDGMYLTQLGMAVRNFIQGNPHD